VPGVCRWAVARSQLCSLAETLDSEIPSPVAEGSSPMPAEPVIPEQPNHPMHALTTAEISRYRRELEHAIQVISPDAPVQADLRRKLDAVTAEQEERVKLASHG